MATSKKHHYLPRFYLKGFTDSANKYFIYDKHKLNIWQSNPDNSFAENHRNTGVMTHQITHETHKFDLAEKILSYFDSKAAIALSEIRNSSPADSILSPERLYIIRFLIISIFWRTPTNDKLRLEIIKNYSFEDLGFGIFNKSTGERSTEVEELLKDIDLWNKMYPILLPITSFTDKFRKLNAEEWKVYYKSNDFHIVTDNPIIFEEFKDFSSLHEELLFPLSSKILLVSSKKYKPHILAPVFSLKVDLLLFHIAGRYIASSSKEYLELLATEVEKRLETPMWAENLKKEIFNHFY